MKRVEAAEEADAGGGGAAAVVVKFKGFSAKLNEQISVGAGRLRAQRRPVQGAAVRHRGESRLRGSRGRRTRCVACGGSTLCSSCGGYCGCEHARATPPTCSAGVGHR